MSELKLVKDRGDYFVPPTTAVAVRVGPRARFSDIDAMHIVAWYECLTCGEQLESVPGRQIYECPECGYEMSVLEAHHLCNQYIESVRRLTFAMEEEPVKKGFWLWRLLRWFGGGRKDKKALSA